MYVTRVREQEKYELVKINTSKQGFSVASPTHEYCKFQRISMNRRVVVDLA